MVSLYFMYYNFGRVHQTLRVTPAMEAGIADHIWSIEEIVGLLKQLTNMRLILRLVMAGCFMLALFGHYRGTTAIINSPFWQAFFLVLGFVILIVDRLFPSLTVSLFFDRRSDDDAPTKLDL
jgi:hypothetical protein